MSQTPPYDAITITRLREGSEPTGQMAEEVREGLAQRPRRLPCKYFYDERGSELFDEITLLPEYYLTRAESEILDEVAEEIVRDVRPYELVELGAGFSRKTRILLEAMTRRGEGGRLVCLDVAEEPLRQAGERLLERFPELTFEGVVGDFEQDLGRISRQGTRLVAFLGSTFGNFEESKRLPFLRQVRRMLLPGDGFLIGLDLVKDQRELEAAYNDAAGVTAEFNKNLLRVLNRELDADFPIDAFEHLARWNEDESRMEMLLRAKRDVEVHLAALDHRDRLEEGEEIRTELSCKFTRERVEDLFGSVDLRLSRWDTDLRERFALALATP
jgi:L-histidine N-alpha-methyltransferase